jgi:cyclase
VLKKRLIGVVTVRNGWAVQSFGYRRYLPLGRPECLVENLDRWGADEILVQVIDRSSAKLGPDLELLERLAGLGLGTPLIYGGGIRSVEDGVNVIKRGADRFTVDALFQDDFKLVAELGERLGVQAVIASMPVSAEGGKLALLDHRTGQSRPLPAIAAGKLSEVLLIDWQHEGTPEGFDQSLIARFPAKDMVLIAFGGISTARQMRSLLTHPQVSAVAVGNFLSYREHAIQGFRNDVACASLRQATYAKQETRFRNG